MAAVKIHTIKAREILASNGFPSLEVKVTLTNKVSAVASVPYGASAGSHEAAVMLDGDEERYGGKGMLRAVAKVNDIIAPALVGKSPYQQVDIDDIMCALDGTNNKSKLGGNAILGVSLAVARVAALSKKKSLYQYIRDTFKIKKKTYVMPHPMMVLIEGGKHADNSTDWQEYAITVMAKRSVAERIRMGEEVYNQVKSLLKKEHLSTNVGNEGAFAPEGIKDNEKPLQILTRAINEAGFKAPDEVGISLDLAASEVFTPAGKYKLSRESRELAGCQIVSYLDKWVKKYPLVSIEDMLHEDAWNDWVEVNKELGKKVLIVGDDLTVTNPDRLDTAIQMKAINSILIKLNQIGTLSETVYTMLRAHKAGFKTIVSHRGGGETNDTFMVDLAVALGSWAVKVGPTRGERVSKYNRLMEVELEVKKAW